MSGIITKVRGGQFVVMYLPVGVFLRLVLCHPFLVRELAFLWWDGFRENSSSSPPFRWRFPSSLISRGGSLSSSLMINTKYEINTNTLQRIREHQQLWMNQTRLRRLTMTEDEEWVNTTRVVELILRLLQLFTIVIIVNKVIIKWKGIHLNKRDIIIERHTHRS